MTHDELLERLDELKYDVGDSGMNEEYKAIYALRAVVELTRKYEEFDGVDSAGMSGYRLAMKQVIQAIEKELS